MTYTGKGINRLEFNACFEHTEGRVKYELGAKPGLYSDSSSFARADCSGFVRWMLSRTLDGFAALDPGFPDGSQNQHEWASEMLTRDVYEFVLEDRTNAIYLCAMGVQADGHGHIWFLQNGSTIECSGGAGVNSSEEHARAYADRVNGCFLVPSYLP